MLVRFVALACLTLFTSVASAQTIAPPTLHGPRGQGGIELSFSTGDYSVGALDVAQYFLVAPLVGGYYKVGDKFALAADWGFAFANFSSDLGDDEASFRFGNPSLAGHFLLGNQRTQGRVGFLFALPVAQLPDDGIDAAVAVSTYLLAIGARGIWDPWLYAAETFSLAFPGRVESMVASHLRLAGEGALAILVPTNDNDTEVVLQFGGEIAYVDGGVDVGLRIRNVWGVTADGDNYQMSLEPYVRGDIGGAFLQARLTMPVDDPYGFAFDDGGVFGLHVGAGTDL